MELTCDHHFRHPPCLGRDANGNLVTKASGVYTTSMVHMIVAVIGLTSGVKDAVKLVGDGLHKHNAKKHENFRIEDVVRFEDTTSSYYLNGLNDHSAEMRAPRQYVRGCVHEHYISEESTTSTNVRVTHSERSRDSTCAQTSVLGGRRHICG
jgi:hypothetical protein